MSRQVGIIEVSVPIDHAMAKAAVAGLRADGPYAVRLRFPQRYVGMHLREIAQWLVEWRMPHNVRLIPETNDDRCVLEIRFPIEKHAYAFERQFADYVIPLVEN